ncbi:MAG: hydrogenase maturation protease [Thermoplasmata archaeon]
MAEDPHRMLDGAGTSPSLVIGVGNANRRDDGVGLAVARRLRTRSARPARIVEFEGEGTGLLDLWEDERFVVVVDAVRSGAAPGTVHRIDTSGSFVFPSKPTSSTHGLSVGEAVHLGRSLGRLPGRLVVYGVEGSEFTPGDELSPPVARAVDRVVESILAERASAPVAGRTAPELPHA